MSYYDPNKALDQFTLDLARLAAQVGRDWGEAARARADARKAEKAEKPNPRQAFLDLARKRGEKK